MQAEIDMDFMASEVEVGTALFDDDEDDDVVVVEVAAPRPVTPVPPSMMKRSTQKLVAEVENNKRRATVPSKKDFVIVVAALSISILKVVTGSIVAANDVELALELLTTVLETGINLTAEKGEESEQSVASFVNGAGRGRTKGVLEFVAAPREAETIELKLADF